MKYFRMCLPIFQGGAKKEAEIFKVSTLEETQGRATKEKHDGATATDMQKDGLLFKKKYTNKFYLFCVFLVLK